MFTLSPPMRASVGCSYFSEEDYYMNSSEASGWYGKGAGELGLAGKVNLEDFTSILHGYHPRTNEPLTKNAGDDIKSEESAGDRDGAESAAEEDEDGKKERRSYWDGTFSAPKSVSILLEVDAKIEEAHNRAVETVIRKMEAEYAYTRQATPGGGTMETVRTSNLVMARFNHYLSRETDPQLHSHIVIANLTQGEDGVWRTLEPRKMYQDQMYFGQIYRNELAANLKELGYKIEVDPPSKRKGQGYFEVTGVPGELIKQASSRREAVVAQRARNDEELKDDPKYTQMTEAEKMERANKDSRKAKDKTLRNDVIRAENRAKLEAALGYSLERLKDEVKKKEGTPAVLSAEECVLGARKAVMEKESAFSEKDVIDRALKTGLGHYTIGQLLEVLEKQADVEYVGTIDRFGREYYTTAAMREIERGILNYVERGRGRSKTAISSAEVEKWMKGTPKQLSAGQRAAVEMICTTKDAVSIIQGDAGGGKTFAMECVKEIMEGENRGFAVRGFAPTGVAAKELTEAGIKESKTIDMLLVNTELQDKAKPGEIWLVDESGMVGSEKMKRFLDIAEQKGAKVVLIGDTKQFQAVDQGKMFADLQAKSKAAKTEITEVKRQKTKHMIAAVKAIKDKDFESANECLKKNDSIKEILSETDRIDYMRDEYINDEKNGIESVILTATNSVRDRLNELIRADRAALGKVTGGGRFNTYVKTGGELDMRLANSYAVGQKIILKQDCDNIPKGTEAEIESINLKDNTIKLKYHNENIKVKDHCGKYDVYDVKKREFGVGDRVIFMKNDHKIGIANGQTGVIKDIREDGTAVIVVGKIEHKQKEIECNLNNRGSTPYNYLDHAYCITNHKSQGSSYDKVIINADISKQRTNYNAFYVQATRAKNDIKIITNDEKKLFEQAKEAQNKLSTLDFGDTIKAMRDNMIDSRISHLAKERKEREQREARNEADCFQKYANKTEQYNIGEEMQEYWSTKQKFPISRTQSSNMNAWIDSEDLTFITGQTPPILAVLRSNGTKEDIATIYKERDSNGEAVYSFLYINPNPNDKDEKEIISREYDLDALCKELIEWAVRKVRYKILDVEKELSIDR